MISGSSLCSSFKVELLQGMHDFLADTFMMALYDSTAPLSPDTTTAYLTEGEITGPGYTAGGQQLLDAQILGPIARAAFVTFDDPVWTGTLTARAALIYNRSNGQRAVAVLDFLKNQSSNQGSFRVQFPPPGPATALIRLL